MLTPLIAWVSLKLFGVSVLGLRLWPALAAWATVVIAGLTAREFGGGYCRPSHPLHEAARLGGDRAQRAGVGVGDRRH